MSATFDIDALRAALESAQRLGMIGDRPVVDAIEHSRAVVRALDDVRGQVVDIGSGGGLPGLVIAHDRPDLHLVLVDRRVKRTDFLQRVIRRHRLDHRIEVLARDVQDLISDVSAGHRAAADASTARGFGPPEMTLRALRDLTRPDGVLVVTEPPHDDRWDPTVLEHLGVRREPAESSVAVFRRAADLG